MMTVFNEFRKFYKNIPKEREPYVRFIPLRSNKKIPECKGSWLNINLNYYEIKNRMNCGGNVGVVALPGGIMIIDIDVDKDGNLKSVDFSNLLDCMNTLTIKTRSGGLHYFFLNDGNYNTQDIHINGKRIGELRANKSYVVGAGSWVVSLIDGRAGGYSVIFERPIKPFPQELEKYFIKGITTNKNEIRHNEGKQLSERNRKIMEDYFRRAKV